MDDAQAISDAMQVVHTLAPGEYAIVEVPDGFTVEAADHLRAAVPDELRGRILLVEGRVHTLKPEETP